MECPHISGEHVMLSGYWRRCPSFSIRSRVGGFRAGYGVLPTVNISQHVTPYDHCVCVCARVFVCLFVEDHTD